jgi:hypothetical protein
MLDPVEFIYNEPLLFIQLGSHTVLLEFGEIAVDLNSNIEIVGPDGSVESISDAFTQDGQLETLWRLIGQKMLNIVMDGNSFRLTFEDGTLILGRYMKSFDFVKVWGPKGCETGYPSVVHFEPGALKRELERMLRNLEAGSDQSHS